MKTLIITFIALVPFLAMAEKPAAPEAPEAAEAGLLRHVVCFKFKEGTKPEQIQKIETEFAALPGKIDTIVDFEWGTDVSTENRAMGFTHCFIVSFKDKAGLEVYAPHEAHKAFVELLLPSLDKVFVIDFVAK